MITAVQQELLSPGSSGGRLKRREAGGVAGPPVALVHVAVEGT